MRLFEDAGINTCIVIYRNIKNRKQDNIIKIIRVKDWDEPNQNLFEFIESNSDNNFKDKNIEIFSKPQKQLSDHKWTLQSEEVSSIFRNFEKNSKRLGKFNGDEGVCRVFQGFSSGLDVLKTDTGKKEVFRVGVETIKQKNLEAKLLKPLIKIGMIRRYQINYTNEYTILTTNDTQIDDFPNIKKHLSEFKEKLENRHDIKKGGFNWWRYANLRNYALLLSKYDKLFVPVVAPENRFVYVHSNEFVCGGDVYVLTLNDTNFDLRYVQGILNSKLMNILVKKNSKALDGSAKTASGKKANRYSYSTTNISNLPIKKATKEQQKQLSEMVIKIESLYSELSKFHNKNTEKKVKIQEQIQKIDSQIDDMVFKLYDLTKEKIEELS